MHQDNYSGLQQGFAWGSASAPSNSYDARGGSSRYAAGDLEDRRRPGEDTQASIETLLRELRQDLRRLDGKIDGIEESAARSHEPAQFADLREQSQSLSLDMSALRQAASTRFDSIETHAKALAASTEALAQRILSAAERDNMSQAQRAAPDAVQSGWDSSSRGLSSRAESKRHRPDNEVESLYGQRRDSPQRLDLHVAKRLRAEESGGKVYPSNSEPDIAETVAHKLRYSHFIVPVWASSTSLQSQPLPGGEGFVSVVEAYKAASKKAPPKALPNVAKLTYDLSHNDPGIYRRNGVETWEQLLPLIQRFVALHIVGRASRPTFCTTQADACIPQYLPPLDSTERRRSTAVLVLCDMEAPFHTKEVNPPSFEAQVEALTLFPSRCCSLRCALLTSRLSTLVGALELGTSCRFFCSLDSAAIAADCS